MIGEMGNKSLRELNKLRGRTSRARRFSPKLSGALHDSATHRSQRVYWPPRDGGQQRVETFARLYSEDRKGFHGGGGGRISSYAVSNQVAERIARLVTGVGCI